VRDVRVLLIRLALISGVTSAGIGAFIAGYTFVYINDKALEFLFDKRGKYYGLAWKAKLLYSYLISDVVKSAVFLPFEARKQRIQMYHNLSDLTIGNMGNFMFRAYTPMLLRDLTFRIISFGGFIKLLNVEHEPSLKYSMSEVQNFIRYKQERGENIEPHIFIDNSRILVKSTFNAKFFNLVICTCIATLITQPFDVICTKMLTQTRLKYKSIIQSYNLIQNEEGVKKLFISGLGVRCSFNILSSMTVLLLFERMNLFIRKAYDEI
jgi:hypothetical protein